jgi:4-hydroxybenzoate polyprenyltransferase
MNRAEPGGLLGQPEGRAHRSRELRYVAERFPVHKHGVGLLLAYAPAFGLYSAAGGRFAFRAQSAVGFASFVALFAILRFVDDLEDLPLDVQRGRVTQTDEGAIRRALQGAIAALGLGLGIVHWGQTTFPVVLSGVIGMLALPFVRRWMTPPELREGLTTGSPVKNAILAVLQEGLILLLMSFIHAAWASESKQTLGAPVVGAVTATVWAQYLFWKYARITRDSEHFPYGLGFAGCRGVLVLLAGVYFVAQCIVRDVCGLATFHVTYALLAACAFAVWASLGIAGRDDRSGRKVLPMGILFVVLTGLGTTCSLLMRFAG